MLLIPSLQTVVILTPRTGTRSLRHAVEARYPDAIHLYRHMEADGVPQGYDCWRKVGVVRDPVERLWSLYKYLQRFGIDYCQEHEPDYTRAQRDSVKRPFEDWLLNNDRVFTSPYDSTGRGRFYPFFTVRHPLPENRKSQFVYLRPDLGTEVVPYDRVAELYRALGVEPKHLNGTTPGPPPELSVEAQAYIARWFAWDTAAALRARAASLGEG